jgi:nickel-type superoxide dismutase maturation protease
MVAYGLVGAAGVAALGALGIAAATFVGARLLTRRVTVEGRSMVPTFEPGDRLLVVRLPRRWPVWVGDVVALADPRAPGRLLVKRVTSVHEGLVTVAGDNAAESTDSRDFGPVERAHVWGRAVYRYGPASRAGPARGWRRADL